MARPGVVVVVKRRGPASFWHRVGLTDQVAIACQNADVVSVFMEGMLPAALGR